MRRGLSTLTATLLSASAARAAGGLSYTPPAAPSAPDPTSLLVRLVGITAATLLFCAGVVWAARRAGRVAAKAHDPAGRLRHEGSVALGRHGTLHLIHADGQAVAVTTDATGLRALAVLSEPFEAALAAAQTAE